MAGVWWWILSWRSLLATCLPSGHLLRNTSTGGVQETAWGDSLNGVRQTDLHTDLWTYIPTDETEM